MRFSLCVIEPAGYKYSHFLYDLCKYLCFSIESAGYDCCILRNKLSTDRTNIVVGAHSQTDPAFLSQIKKTGPYILLNTEIITGDTINNWSVQKTFAEIYLPLMRQATVVWTGVKKNIEALKKLNVEADRIFWGYHPLIEEIHHKKNKDIDFLFCGSITPHRKKMLDQLSARGAKVVTMFDDAAMYRNDLIARSRVNLAPNQGPGMNHLGGGRVLYLINNRAIVVVEQCIDQSMYEECFPWAETDQWADLCMETLRRPDLPEITEEYYERFKKIHMGDLISPLLENFIRRIQPPKHAVSSAVNEDSLQTTMPTGEIITPTQPFEHTNSIPGLTSIIILTHNRLEQTKKCVKSIRKHTPEAHEIIFVDNASTDGTVKWLQSQVKENKNYRLIENSKNVGVAKGRNQGMYLSQGELILLLDNDVIVSEGWLSGMQECLKHAPGAGIVGPMTNSKSGLQQIADESYRSVDYLDKYVVKFKEQYHHRRISCRNIAGFCMLFNRTLAEKIGLLDERFDTGRFEDEDFCWRSALGDYRNYIAGDVFVHHTGGKHTPGSRKIISQKWTLSTSTPEGRKLAVLKARELANDFYHRGQMEQAIDALINCIKVIPGSKEIYYELALIFLETKQYSKAWEVIESTPDAARNDLKGLECTGYVKEGLGLDNQAAECVDQILSQNENHSAALNLKGVLAFKKGEKEKAQDYFKKAITADSGYGEAYTNLGVLDWGTENKEAAFSHMRKGFMLSPALPDASSLYYSVVSSLGRFSEAEAYFKEACRLNPNHKNLAFLLIDILIQQGKYDAAIIKIEDALALFGLDDATLSAALAVREKIGPMQIDKPGKKGSLSLCMIVKNEEKHLVKCLKSVRDVVDEMIIVDTGSTDKTVDIAIIFGAKVFEFPWTGDFAAARNHSLSQATGNWLLILDADEVLSALDFKELREILHRKSSTPVAYSIATRNYIRNVGVIGWTQNTGEYPEEAGSGWVISKKVRLFTRSKDAFFSNPVHETLENSLKKAKIPIAPCKIVVHHYGKLDAQKDLQKGEDYYLLGKIKYENDPTNMKYVLELARQSQVLQKYDEAVELWSALILLFLKASPDTPEYNDIVYSTQGDPLSEMYIQLAAAYLMINRYDEALETASKAMKGKIKLKETVHIYASCEIISGSLDNAFSELDELLKTIPDYPPALLLMAVVACLKGEREKAQELFGTLKQNNLQITGNLNKLAKQLDTRGKSDQALLVLTAMIDNKISDVETMALLEEYQKGQLNTG